MGSCPIRNLAYITLPATWNFTHPHSNKCLSFILSLPPFLTPSLPGLALLIAFSLFLIPFLLCSHTEAGCMDRLWVYVQSGRGSTQRINALLEKPQEIQTSPCPRSFSLGPDSSHPPVSILMCPFHSLTSSLFLLSGYRSLSTFLWFRQIYAYASSPLALMSCKTHPSQHNDR